MPIRDVKGPRIHRRSLLKGMGALALAPLMVGLGGRLANAHPAGQKKKADAVNHRTRLVLLGTTGGMTWWPGSDRASASQVLVVGDAMYVIDLGFGATHRMAQAFNHGKFLTYRGQTIQGDLSSFLAKVRAVFITHMHMDHLGDYPTFLEIGARAGFGVPDKLKIFGPCNRGRLDENVSGYNGMVQMAGVDTPQATPTPGIRQTTDLILQAFATTFNNCTHDENYPEIPNIIDVKEIGDPDGVPWPAGFHVPDPAKTWTRAETCPAMDPFPIYSDDLVKVSAVLVDHAQVYPSFAFRFDTEDGSVVISGDTGPDTKGNLQKLAQGCDVLVHEIIDNIWVEGSFKGAKPGDPAWPLYQHVLSAHTALDDVGKVAASCRAKTLVLSHIGPGNTPVARLRQAQKGFDGRLIIGEDLMQIGVGKALRRTRV
ncbi:MBL fold metallo-hydrolase [Desulfolutivibrio sp.]|uniref:MBL fold metallo-hydrolase n=1 Tax=Desulfolutivibrio sp. TaxID=2773296 RepID=UPI002F96A9E3